MEDIDPYSGGDRDGSGDDEGRERRIPRRDFLQAGAAGIGAVWADHGPAPTRRPTGAGRADQAPSAGINKVEHIIVMIQENRSVDHLLGQLHRHGQPEFEPAPALARNPDPLNPPATFGRFHKEWYCEAGSSDETTAGLVVGDLNHSWNGMHLQYADGAMDGFTTSNSQANPVGDPDPVAVDPEDPGGARSMGYYDRSDLPFYYALYSEFATSDRFFSSVLGPTQPNRLYLICGTSFGNITTATGPANIPPSLFGFSQPTIFGKLSAKGVTWKYYYGSRVGGFPGTVAYYFKDTSSANFAPISQFFTDLKNDTLPQVCFIDPAFTSGTSDANTAAPNAASDEHPCSNVQVGQWYVWKALRALWASKAWASSVLFLTYDEAGGYYDHVVPPAATPPDAIAPKTTPANAAGKFDRFGFRVPFVAVSPFARRKFVSHDVLDHTSILQFIEQRFGIAPLTKRDAAAGSLLGLFDFTTPDGKLPDVAAFTREPRVSPSVRMTAPASSGVTLSGTVVPLSAYAVVGVNLRAPLKLELTFTSVDFRLQGGTVNKIIASARAPGTNDVYRTTWKSTSVPNGTYALTAEVVDSKGTRGTSAPVTVVVQN